MIKDSSDLSDSESSSTVSHDNDDSDGDGSLSDKSESDDTKKGVTRTKGELTLDDLPPIEDLQISVEENQCKPIGSISQIVNKMVVIQSLPHTPPLNIDTVLFVDRGQRAIGKIFDVFGPVEEPLYCVRFNSAEHVAEKKIAKEQMVYCAPETKYTSYIHTAELMKNKGSDASWTDNNEPPVSCLDFSDDEDEARHKRSLKKANGGLKRDGQVDDKLFVKKMNQKNLELTAKRKKEDEAKQKRGSNSRRSVVNPSIQNENTGGLAAKSQPFVPVSDNYRVKTRTFTNSEQPSRPAQYYNVATAATVATSAPPHPPKFDALARSGNFMYSGYSGPPPPPPSTTAYTFPPQSHYVCTPRQVPGAPPQNYLTMYAHAPIPSQAVMGPPFSNFTSTTLTAIPTYPAQPPLPPPRLPATTILPPMPPSYTNYTPLRAATLPSTVSPQTATYFHCEGPHQTAPGLIRVNVNTPFHPQFMLPPPPPPPPPPSMPSQPAQQHQRGDTTVVTCPERRPQQYPSTTSFYPTPHYKF